jgi:hypothetical protein
MTEAEMMKQAELTLEVETLIDERFAAEKKVPQSWLVKEMIDRHGDIHGDDVPFFKLCGNIAVAATVRAVMKRCLADEDELNPAQAELFPGYKRLQRRYSIERNGERILVALQGLTIQEGRAKAHEKRAMAKGNTEHAEELDDFFDRLEAAQQSAA